jgi:GNAT superfamily N-acetyltransferase
VNSSDSHELYEFSDDPSRVDRDAVWAFLTTHAYWGQWRTRDIVERQIAGAWRVVGAYEITTGQMVGFARAVSDGCSLAYLADVFVHPDHRGHKLGVQLVQTIIEDGPGANFRWMLHTADAHGLYGKFGFTAPDKTYMERAGGPPKVPSARPGIDSLTTQEPS